MSFTEHYLVENGGGLTTAEGIDSCIKKQYQNKIQ